MDIKEQELKEQVAEKLLEIYGTSAHHGKVSSHELLAAKLIIPLVRADTLKSISKEATKLDGTTYLVPDYSKFRDATKEGE